MTDIYVREPRKTTAMELAEVRLGRPLEVVIRELYIDQGLMQREVARRLGIDTGTLSRWMRELGVEARPKGRGSAAAGGIA